jgi:hypothetical protein
MNLPSRVSFSLVSGAITLLLGISSAHAQTEATAASSAAAPAEATPPSPAPSPADSAAPVALEAEAEAEPAPAPAAEPTPVAPAESEPMAPADPTLEAPAEAPKPPPPLYSLPFQLRPVGVGNVVRSDTAFAFYEAPNGESGSTVASMLLASYKVTDDLAPLVRLGIVSNSPPDVPMGPDSATAFLNPVIGATYSLKLGKDFRLAPFLGIALPLGSGGGNEPEAKIGAARGAGILARSAMDNAMFAVNDLVIFPGVGFAYIANGFTAQVEATVLQLTQVKGDTGAPPNAQPDDSKTNFTGGIHVGYFFAPVFSVGAELRHQRWLSTPAAVKANSKARDNSTFAFGPRFHFKLGEKMWLRPAIALALPLDDPMSDSKHKVVQLDIPFAF